MKIEKDGKTFYVCECGKEFEKRKAFIGHCSRCEIHLGHKPTNDNNFKKFNENRKYNKYIKININIPGNCKYCGKECKNQNSLKNHEIRCAKNPNSLKSAKNKKGLEEYNKEVKQGKRIVWNKGQTKENNYSLMKASIKTSKILKELYRREKDLGIKRSLPKWVKNKISSSMINKNICPKNYHGNYKCGYYKNIFCASSYELAYLIYCLDHNINIKRNEKPYKYKYKYKGKIHNYFPDFIINDNLIIEIKGYKSRLVNIKAKSVKDKPIKILYRKDLDFAFDYIYIKYNKLNLEIIELYDDYNLRYKKENGKYLKIKN